jgi:hypothetical protein
VVLESNKKLKKRGEGKQRCITAGYNVLSLFGHQPDYNLCRNLEWLVCAAKGKLYRQPGGQILFSPLPALANLADRINGLTANWRARVYQPEVVYAVEVCSLLILCDNGHLVFGLRPLEPFVCQWREGALGWLVEHIEAGKLWGNRAPVSRNGRRKAWPF